MEQTPSAARSAMCWWTSKLLCSFIPSTMLRSRNIKSTLQTTSPTHQSSLVFLSLGIQISAYIFTVTKIFSHGFHLAISNWTCYPESMLKNPFWGRCKKICINGSHSLVIDVWCCPKLLWNRGKVRNGIREDFKNKIEQKFKSAPILMFQSTTLELRFISRKLDTLISNSSPSLSVKSSAKSCLWACAVLRNPLVIKWALT